MLVHCYQRHAIHRDCFALATASIEAEVAMPLHECDGEHCSGCGECYHRTGQFHCIEVCEHSERCAACKMLPEDCICCGNGVPGCDDFNRCSQCQQDYDEALEDAYWAQRIDEARGK